jgi:hypothetical protein
MKKPPKLPYTRPQVNTQKIEMGIYGDYDVNPPRVVPHPAGQAGHHGGGDPHAGGEGGWH